MQWLGGGGVDSFYPYSYDPAGFGIELHWFNTPTHFTPTGSISPSCFFTSPENDTCAGALGGHPTVAPQPSLEIVKASLHHPHAPKIMSNIWCIVQKLHFTCYSHAGASAAVLVAIIVVIAIVVGEKMLSDSIYPYMRTSYLLT